jgi:hypothetical protein
VRYSFGDGGTCYEPFARMTANISLELEPRDVLAKIMAVCDGSYGVDQNGQFTMWIGKWEDPRVIFTDSDISGVREDFGPTLAEETNYLNITYPDPRMNCDMVQAPIYQDTDSIAKVGRRIDTMQLEYCPSPSQAWRMARRYLMRINRRRRITLRLNARGMMAIGQRYIGISAATFQIYGTFRLLQVYPGENLAEWNVDLVEVAKDIFDDPMCPTDPIHDLPIVQPSGTPATPAPPLPNLSTYYDAASGNYRVRIDWAPQSYATWWSSAQNLLLPDPNYVYTAIYSTVGDPLSGGVPVFDVNARLSDFTLLTPPFPKGTTVWVLVSYVPLQYTKAGPYSLSASIKI